MFKPKSIVKSLKHQELDVSQEFNILCWNVAKLTLKSSYKEFVDTLIEEHQLDILLLQEVKKHLSHEIELKDYSYVLSPNIETKKHMFGVMSAFKSSCISEHSILSKKQELRYATHKTSLITHHKTSSEHSLLVVNLHAINFVKSSDFKHELDSLHVSIKNHQGAMIVAGDFNTWSAKRISYLREFSASLELQQVDYSHEKDIKRVFSNTLDHIFYRGVELVGSSVIDSKKISDHNPIIAKFKL